MEKLIERYFLIILIHVTDESVIKAFDFLFGHLKFHVKRCPIDFIYKCVWVIIYNFSTSRGRGIDILLIINSMANWTH